MTEPAKSLADARPDLVHPFQCRPGEEGTCSHFHLWLGGYVRCGMKESDPIHCNGPHLLTASDGEMAYCKGSPETCEACWQEARMAKLDADRQAQRRPRRLLRDMTGAEFGEACADMVKAIERSRQ